MATIDHNKHTLDEIQSALHAKLESVTPHECTSYTIVATAGGLESSCITEGSEYLKNAGIERYNLRNERIA